MTEKDLAGRYETILACEGNARWRKRLWVITTIDDLLTWSTTFEVDMGTKRTAFCGLAAAVRFYTEEVCDGAAD